MRASGSKALAASGLALVIACTSLNKATFAIRTQQQIASDEMLRGVEESFRSLGFDLERETEYIYPEARNETIWFLGHRELPLGFQSTTRQAILRLEQSGTLYVEWIEVTDLRRELKPEYFSALHARIARDLKTRLGIDAIFEFVPAASPPAASTR